MRSVVDEASKLKDDVRLGIFRNEKISAKDGRHTVATSSYALAGAGGRFKILSALAKNPECHAHDTGILIRDSFRKYLQGQKSL
jgi:hypothetical protein